MVGVDEFEIGEFRGAEIDALHEDLVGIYRVCYSGAPWYETEADVAAYAERIREWAERDGFAGLVARDPDGALAGVTYGWNGPAEIGGTPLPGVGAERPFHVGDLMVDPSARHRGLGRTLLQRLVTNRIPAVLITHPDAEARRLYEATGWRRVGQVTSPDSPEWLVYVSDTAGDR